MALTNNRPALITQLEKELDELRARLLALKMQKLALLQDQLDKLTKQLSVQEAKHSNAQSKVSTLEQKLAKAKTTPSQSQAHRLTKARKELAAIDILLSQTRLDLQDIQTRVKHNEAAVSSARALQQVHDRDLKARQKLQRENERKVQQWEKSLARTKARHNRQKQRREQKALQTRKAREKRKSRA